MAEEGRNGRTSPQLASTRKTNALFLLFFDFRHVKKGGSRSCLVRIFDFQWLKKKGWVRWFLIGREEWRGPLWLNGGGLFYDYYHPTMMTQEWYVLCRERMGSSPPSAFLGWRRTQGEASLLLLPFLLRSRKMDMGGLLFSYSPSASHSTVGRRRAGKSLMFARF